jgi:hypothetical protein
LTVPNTTYPHPGIQVHKNQHGITCLRLHYDADPEKAKGKKTFVPAIEMELSPWALQQFEQMTDPALYLREFEIQAEATLGSLIYQMDDEATLEPSFPIPLNWTRRMALDPHPSVPHAFLWCATDPWGDRWYYRELWPSKACFRYDGPRLLGASGPCPPDDPSIRIKDYVETVKWMESSENPENVVVKPDRTDRFDETIFARVIDYAARAFGKGTNDDPEQPNFQVRFEQYMCMPELRVTCPLFQDAKKDHDVGFEMVNAGLKPRRTIGSDDKPRKRSQIHIFRDKCPELIYEIKNMRRERLTPAQAVQKDPSGKAVQVRAHMCDNLRYLEMSNPIYIAPPKKEPRRQQLAKGFSY